MADAHQLVIDLLLLRLQLHFVWKRLPFTSSTYAEMFAERLQTVLRRLYHTEDETFHIVLLLFCHLHIYDVSRHSELYEKYCSVYPCQCLSFCCHRLDGDILQNDILLFPCHISKIKQPRVSGAAKLLKLSLFMKL